MPITDGASTVNILRNTLNLLDDRLIDHGDRVAYLLYKMLELKGGFTKKELDTYLILGILHDISAYKTDEIDQMLTFDSEGVWSHSIYGYLYLKYLSPMQDYAEILLYHHLDYQKFKTIEYHLKHISMYLFIADRVDILLNLNHGIFTKKMMEKYRDTKFWGEGLDLFYQANQQYHLVRNLKDDSYKKELGQLISRIELTSDECREYLKMLVFMVDFREENSVLRTVHTNIMAIGISREMSLSPQEANILYYATLVYDLGMLSVPESIIKAARHLSELEMDTVRLHVDTMVMILSGNINKKVIDTAKAHHEKLDGSGYPDQLKGSQISRLQRILTVSDIVGALNCENGRRKAYDKDKVIDVLTEEAKAGKLCPQVVQIVVDNYDKIQETASEIFEKVMKNYWLIKESYDIIIARFEKYNCTSC